MRNQPTNHQNGYRYDGYNHHSLPQNAHTVAVTNSDVFTDDTPVDSW
jgi:hypothetical protein